MTRACSTLTSVALVLLVGGWLAAAASGTVGDAAVSAQRPGDRGTTASGGGDRRTAICITGPNARSSMARFTRNRSHRRSPTATRPARAVWRASVRRANATNTSAASVAWTLMSVHALRRVLPR